MSQRRPMVVIVGAGFGGLEAAKALSRGAIDVAGRRVQTGAGPISYDYLVIATGATHSYFGHDDWIDFAPGLKRIEDATRIRRSILLAFEQAKLAREDAERQRLLTFVIVGG